jgi:hypothetical protein
VDTTTTTTTTAATLTPGTEEKYNKVNEEFEIMLQHRANATATRNGVSSAIFRESFLLN